MTTPHFFRDSSERLTFDTDRVTALEYPAVRHAVVEKFHLTADGELIVGPDQMFWEFRFDGHLVELAWDIWMGFTVTAMSPDAESLVREIAEWICSTLLPPPLENPSPMPGGP
jgi:hypothetical protein